VLAERLANTWRRKLRSGEHPTDQLLLPMALGGRGGFTALKMNLHARTNVEVIAKVLPVRLAVTERRGMFRSG
jgi:RNA 3'-terminal phosphate cyclase (ATP)